MINYEHAKIYKIHPKGDESICYIGATTRPYLCQRMGMHKVHQRKNTNSCRTSQLFNEYGIDGCVIALVEAVSCKSKQELSERERYYIEEYRKNGVHVINHGLPLRSRKEWYKDNRETVLQKKKLKYQANKEAILQRARERYQARKLLLNNPVKLTVKDRMCSIKQVDV